MRHYAVTVATLEDKIVQRAVVGVLNAVYEADFRVSPTGSGPGAGRMTRWMRWRPGSTGEG